VRLAPGRLHARTRLALWYTALLAVTMLALGGGALWAVGRALDDDVDDALRIKAAAVESELDFGKNRLTFQFTPDPGSHAPAVTAGLDVVRIWDRGRRLIFQLEGVPTLAATEPQVIDDTLAGESGYLSVETVDGTTVRLYTLPFYAKDKVVGAIQVGRSEVELESILAELRMLGAAGLALALAVAWAGGTFLAGRALAPVAHITAAARRIEADDLSQRLRLALPDDELGRLATAFDDMIDRLDRAFRRERQFTADASHELRNPLATIRTEADVALKQPRAQEAYVRALRSIRVESERLGHLVESLLALARSDAGVALDGAPLDLQELVAEVAAQVAPRAHDLGLHLEVRLEETGPVIGDGTWLARLVLNLLDNALRHTPPGGQVAVALEPAPNGVLLTVSDTGEGIAAEHLPHVFERFYRADHARARATGGSGLGLAICDWVARTHGGRLEVHSQPGRGATFTLWLPAAAAPASRSHVGQAV
jgi:heavy metal sensor kinase